MNVADVLSFLLAWTERPWQVGAVAPSGTALADLMTGDFSASTGPVLELGPGTGVFTRALIARGVREQDLTLIEQGAEFARMLRHRFPAARVREMDAADLARTDLFDDRPVGGVVSGLPLLAMPPRKIMALLSGAFAFLRTGAAFYQFTYGLRCPVPRPVLDRLGLKATRVGSTVANLPPARVYRITRRPPSRAGVALSSRSGS